jgi:hypothetical protein
MLEGNGFWKEIKKSGEIDSDGILKNEGDL